MDHELNNDVPADPAVAAAGESTMPSLPSPPPGLVARLIAPPIQPIEARAVLAATIPAEHPPRPWGFWATAAWTALGAFIEVIVSIVLLAIFLVPEAMRNPAAFESSESLEKLVENGLLLSISTIVMTPIALAYLFPVIRWRGWRMSEYLALTRPTSRQTLRWLAVIAAYMVITDTVTSFLGRDIVPPFMVNAYRTAWSVPLLVFAVVLIAPFYEEIVFRGFMYRGIAGSRLGPAGAILISTVLWSLLHVQYDWYGISQIAVGGVLLGLARHRTGSVVTPMLMHLLINAGATVEVIIKVRMMV
jgi:uncharacterized protein